jgi:uncharacterized coiled-coil protein SlyX
MLLMFRPQSRRLPAVALLAVSLFLIGATSVRAQAVAALNPAKVDRGPGAVSESTDGTTPEKKPDTTEEKLSAIEQMLLEQGQRLNQLQQTIAEQQETIRLLASRLTTAERKATTAGPAETAQPAAALAEGASQPAHPGESPQSQSPSVDDRIKKLEGQVAKFGPLRFSGDFRLRADALFRPATTDPDPPLQHLQNVRARYRLRFNFDTDLDASLSFHAQLGSGPINNNLTLDQDFASTTVRHPFFINEVWVDYHPKKSIQLQGGRVQEVFADNSRFLFDDDIRFNGFNEKFVWALKKKPLRLSSIEFRAGQYIFTNPNVAVITPGSPLASAGQIVGTTGRSANLFHQGVLVNQKYNDKWSYQFGGDVQLYRNPNQIALSSTANGVVLLIQPGIGLALSGPLPGTGTATTTPGGAIYTARNFQIARATYRLDYAGFERDGHMYPVQINFQIARNVGVGIPQRDAWLVMGQVGRITKRGDMSFMYLYTSKGANSMISQVTDDDLGGAGTSGVNIHTSHFRFEYGLAKKVTLQSLFFIQSQISNSGDFPNFFVPLGAFAPRAYRMQQQVLFQF